MALTADDRLAILELIALADNCATARDAPGYAELFTEDAVMRGAMGRADGRDSLRAAVANVWAREPAHTLHLTLNAVIDDASADPVVNSMMLMVQPGAPPTVLGAARVRQVIRRIGDDWQIRDRSIEAL